MLNKMKISTCSGEWLGEGSWWENNFTYCENTSWQQPLLVLMTGCLSNKIHVILPYLMSQVHILELFVLLKC